MHFPKTVKDTYGDPVEVDIENDHVYVTVTEEGRDPAMASLSPKKARRIAKALVKAADAAENFS